MNDLNEKSGAGAVIGAIIVIVVLLAGAFYFYGQRVEKQRQFDAMRKAAEANTATVSDEIDSLLKEASSTNFDNLGKGIENL